MKLNLQHSVYFFLVTLLLITSSMCSANDTDKRKQLDELLVLMNVNAITDSMYNQVGSMLQSTSQSLKITPAEKPIYDKHHQRLITLMRDELGWDKIKGPIVEVYMANFNEKEIQDMLTFYKSETGQSLVKKQPQVMQQFMPKIQEIMASYVPKVQALSKEFSDELQAERAKAKKEPF